MSVDGISEDVVNDFKWLLTGGPMLLAGSVLPFLGGAGALALGSVLFVVGIVLLVGGFYGTRFSYDARQRRSEEGTARDGD